MVGLFESTMRNCNTLEATEPRSWRSQSPEVLKHRRQVAAPVLRKLLSRRLSLFDDAQQLVAHRLRHKRDDEVNDAYVRKTAESVAKTLLKKEAKQSARQISDELDIVDETTVPGSRRSIGELRELIVNIQAGLSAREGRVLRMSLEFMTIEQIVMIEDVCSATIYNCVGRIIARAIDLDGDDDPQGPSRGPKTKRCRASSQAAAPTSAIQTQQAFRRRGNVALLLTLPAFVQLVSHLARAGPQHWLPYTFVGLVNERREFYEEESFSLDRYGCPVRWVIRAREQLETRGGSFVGYLATFPAFEEFLADERSSADSNCEDAASAGGFRTAPPDRSACGSIKKSRFRRATSWCRTTVGTSMH
jgi:hypothetical protein